MHLQATDWRPTLLAALGQAMALAYSGLLSASGAVGFDNRDLKGQHPFSPPQLQRYVTELVRRYDTNGDGLLQTNEWRLMRGEPQRIDHNGDQLLTSLEILRHASQYAAGKRLAPPQEQEAVRLPAPSASPANHLAPGSPTARRAAKPFFVPDRFLPQGLPDWFRARDANGDAQLSLAEFAPTGEAQLAAQFQRSDINRDGLITPAEAVRTAERLETVRSTGQPSREENATKVPSAAPE